MTRLKLAEMTRTELAELAPSATVVVPLGSTEQHGPHLPVCTDTAIVTHLAERAALEAAGAVTAVVAPTLPFGFAHHHLPFGGTMSIGLRTYLDVLTDLGASLHASGFRRLLFLNGHGGNDAAVRAVGDRLVFEHGLDIHVAGTSYWTCAAPELAQLEDQIGAPVPGHAGGFETSCLLSIAPELVQLRHRPPPEPQPQALARTETPRAAVRRPGLWAVSEGRSDDAAGADASIGASALTTVTRAVARFLVEFHTAADPTAP